MTPLALTRHTATSALGRGLAAHLAALRAGASGLAPCAFATVDLPTFVGEVAGLDAEPLTGELAAFDCRNNRLAHAALAQDGFAAAVQRCAQRVGPARIGVLLGTSTSGVLSTEIAYRHRDPFSGALPAQFRYAETHSTYSVARFVRHALRLSGPASVTSTACSSSAKVFAAAARMIAAGVIDAAVVGGVDSLCLTTLYGFHSLQLTSRQPCRPFDVRRDGISIGEAAAFVLLERAAGSGGLRLLGAGESSDAHHMSAPHPQGAGAQLAMRGALVAAGLEADAIDYINLHGTGTASNDLAEARAVHGIFATTTPCSSTKGATGHALGAAGALEAVLCALALEHGVLPGGVNHDRADPQLQVNYQARARSARLRRVLSNSFGFGGSNCALVFGRDD